MNAYRYLQPFSPFPNQSKIASQSRISHVAIGCAGKSSHQLQVVGSSATTPPLKFIEDSTDRAGVGLLQSKLTVGAMSFKECVTREFVL
jgi:hypothetical protein